MVTMESLQEVGLLRRPISNSYNHPFPEAGCSQSKLASQMNSKWQPPVTRVLLWDV